MDRLSPMVTEIAITERRDDLLMFHACALADPATGDTVLLFGPSGPGKTTVARTLGTELGLPLRRDRRGRPRDLRSCPTRSRCRSSRRR